VLTNINTKQLEGAQIPKELAVVLTK